MLLAESESANAIPNPGPPIHVTPIRSAPIRSALTRTAIEMANDIHALWAAIESANSNVEPREAPGGLMNPPATVEQVDRLGSRIGLTIPDSLRNSLMIHDGITKSQHGHRTLIGSMYPLSCAEIEAAFQNNARRDAESIAEWDAKVATHRYWIPLFADITAHVEIYIDANDRTVLCKTTGSSQPCESFRYSSYEEFLKVLLTRIESGEEFEWPYDQPEHVSREEADALEARAAAVKAQGISFAEYLESLATNSGTGESVFADEAGEEDRVFLVTGTGTGSTKKEANVAAIEDAIEQLSGLRRDVSRRHENSGVKFSPKVNQSIPEAHSVRQTDGGELHSAAWKMYGSILIAGRDN